ncbi:hypothetical protein BpHYR1_050909 [Brachionus plicatilis]|uniref:Uncharacterized protein n=1 Tax=Brachionus plicatilis TaxID=10195 RepID=A0A3M7RJA6_BRAPC|nr:hypothetical protein BpHYR1_050909 [Brachionus plicatilis]
MLSIFCSPSSYLWPEFKIGTVESTRLTVWTESKPRPFIFMVKPPLKIVCSGSIATTFGSSTYSNVNFELSNTWLKSSILNSIWLVVTLASV